MNTVSMALFIDSVMREARGSFVSEENCLLVW